MTDRKKLTPIKTTGPLFNSNYFHHMKDPCIAFDGATWHIYGTGAGPKPGFEIVHATASSIEGPWKELEPAVLRGVDGPHVAAPSVIYDTEDRLFHMSIQMDYTGTGGGIEYLVSADGTTFTRMGTLLSPSSESELGMYDPHFSQLSGKKYKVYAGVRTTKEQFGYIAPQPEVYLAKSSSNLWCGPWERMDRILSHEEVAWHHNQLDHPDYEWGIEGPQLVELPSGKILLNATSFLPEGPRGTRQRVFFALADNPRGPFTSLGPVLEPNEEWESGENGHASAIVCEDKLYLFYQARSKTWPEVNTNRWFYGLAVYSLKDIEAALS